MRTDHTDHTDHLSEVCICVFRCTCISNSGVPDLVERCFEMFDYIRLLSVGLTAILFISFCSSSLPSTLITSSHKLIFLKSTSRSQNRLQRKYLSMEENKVIIRAPQYQYTSTNGNGTINKERRYTIPYHLQRT